MPCVTRRVALPLFAILSAVLAGCTSPKPAYEREDFTQNDVFSRTFPTASTTACDAGRRALLSQGYNIDRFDPCLLYTSPSPRDQRGSRMPSSA